VGLEANETKKSMVFRKKGDSEFSLIKSLIIGPNKDTLSYVYARRNAIAYVSLGQALTLAHKSHKIEVLTLDSVQPTLKNVKNGRYPLIRPLNLITKGDPKGTAKDFIQYMLGNEGQLCVSNERYIPLKY
jgi:phosphate transport system substrate-binding protein